eukprot:COSAG01_NODE_147_length_24095_cov_25.855428_6_plen_120_part_00
MQIQRLIRLSNAEHTVHDSGCKVVAQLLVDFGAQRCLGHIQEDIARSGVDRLLNGVQKFDGSRFCKVEPVGNDPRVQAFLQKSLCLFLRPESIARVSLCTARSMRGTYGRYTYAPEARR